MELGRVVVCVEEKCRDFGEKKRGGEGGEKFLAMFVLLKIDTTLLAVVEGKTV